MKKFYAPTGTFKSGPIAVQTPPSTSSSLLTPPEETTEDEDKRPEYEELEAATYAPITSHSEIKTEHEGFDEVPAAQTVQQAAVTEISKNPATSLPSPVSEFEGERTRDEDLEIFSDSLPLELPRDASIQAQPSSFEEFAVKWRRYLYPGQLAVMRTLYELTFARGVSDCFIQYSQIASATKMTRRNCINVMNSLVDRGFVERLEVRNDSTAKGIRLKVHTEPLT